MNVTRRDLLAGAAASVLLPAVARAQSYKVIQARAGLAQIAPQGYARTSIWGYDGQVPGPEIRVPQGARVQRQLLNALPQPTALHWHGIRIEHAMDGVPGLT